MNNSALKYHPLQDSEIRLITIKPAPRNHPIECRLENIRLSKECQFIALSYVWGNPKDLLPIIVNDVSFTVTRNLYHALCQLREWVAEGSEVFENYFSSSGQYFFWADAICLNQDDDNEKTQQIPRMRDVYGTAVLVCGWLGLPKEGKENMIDKIFTMGRKLAAEPFRKADGNIYLYTGMMLALGDELPAFSKTFAEVIDLPWFTRVWILQEFVLPRACPLLVLGRYYCPFIGIASIYASLTFKRHNDLFDFDDRTDQVLRSTTTLIGMELLREWHTEHLRTPLYTSGENHLPAFAQRLGQVLSRKSPFHRSTLPHDGIYGVLGMAQAPDLPLALKPDYNKPYSLVCQDYARFLIENIGDLTILSGSGERFENENLSIPSWVPDFNWLDSRFEGARPRINSPITFSSDGKRMTVEGISLGKCVKVFQAESSCWSAFEKLEKEVLVPASTLRSCSPDLLLNEWLDTWIRPYFTISITALRKHYDVRMKGKPLVVHSLEDILAFEDQKGQVSQLMSSILVQLVHEYVLLSENGSIGILLNCSKMPFVDDLLCIFKGMKTISVLRPYGSSYKFIGICQPHCRLSSEEFDDVFFSCREVQKFVLS